MRRLISFGSLLFLLLLTTYPPPSGAQAKSSAPQPPQVSSAYDLIDAVNNLRASYGLPAYQTNSILMAVAQAHSEYQASIGEWTHIGPGGSSPSQRALAAGYPVGGWFSENVGRRGINEPVQNMVDAWMSDAPHQNTMLSSTLREVGAGVATAGDKVYYTLDAGLATGSPPAAYTPGATEGLSTGLPKIPIVSTGTVIPNTPNPDGSIIHIVRKGDTIYGIAFAYGIPVEELLRMNGLTLDSVIYVGKQLTIRPAFTPTPTSPTSTPTRRPTATPWPTSTATATLTSTPLVPTPNPKAAIPVSTGMVSVSVIILLALAIAGAVAWLGSRGSNR